jgi:hypothetical protein
LTNPFRRGARGCGMLVQQNHAAGGANGSIMVRMFVCLCLASQKPFRRDFHSRQNGLRCQAVNSLKPKTVPAGTKNSRSEGILLAKHLKHTAHKHHHHVGAVCPSSGMVLLDEHTPPPGSLRKGLAKGCRRRVLVESIN